MNKIRFIILIVFTICCKPSEKLNNWFGHYEYNEEHIEALAGYEMIMSWTLSIKQENGNCIALIEVNGQQTNMIIKANVNGDKNKINLTFDKGIEGIGYQRLKKGDDLLELKLSDGKIITKWIKLTPILQENFKNNTICFQLKNK